MAVTVTNQATPLGNKMVHDTSANGTAATNTTGAAGVLFFLQVDNTANAQISYFKMYDNASPTVGTTAPHFVFMVPANASRAYALPLGVAFSAAFSHCCTTAGGTAGNTGPANPVVVTYVTT